MTQTTSRDAQASPALDAAAAAKAAFDAAQDDPFPQDLFTAPELRWAVIGCGAIADQMARSLALAGRRIAGVANRHVGRARSFAGRWGVERVYDSVDELYADPDIDVVYVTTPHHTHITYLRGALAAGKHVLCEKPVTLNAAELQEALGIADEHGVQLVEGTTVMHMPLYRELIRRAMAGEFGTMNLAQVNFGSYKPFDPSNRFFSRGLAGGALLDIGVYALSLIRLFMVSQPNDVVSIANACETGVDVTSGIVMRNPEMQMGVAALSLHSRQPKRAMLSFERCFVEVMNYPRADEATITWTDDGRREVVRAGREAYALCYETADLERAVAGDEVERNMIAYAADVMELMTALRRQWGISYPEESAPGVPLAGGERQA